MKLHEKIEQHWQQPNPILRGILSPFSRIFAQIAAKRRQNFLSGSLKTQKLPVPVVVVGNIHAGGTGKTPIVSSLVLSLQNKGLKVGIVSRGYGRKSTQTHVLNEKSTADDAGDEPLMLYRQTHAPVAVGATRHAAGMALLTAYPDLQIIVSDDGLQHYRLARDVEIAVFPAADVGRDDLDVLPNGGLREPISRLQDVDFVVVSNATSPETASAFFRLPEKRIFASQIQISKPYRLQNRSETWHSGSLKQGETCAALAGIARPQRFFKSLNELGIVLNETRVLPDHAALCANDLPPADHVFITEKDAVKLSPPFAENVWVLPIIAEIQPDLADAVLHKLRFQAA